MDDKTKYAVGIMSGTSLDGIDAALVKIKGCGEDIKVQLLEFINEELPQNIVKQIKDCCSIEKSDVEHICSLNFKLGYLFAESVKKVCDKAKINIKDVDFIGSHGQTIFHNPQSNDRCVKSTLQIGEPAVIAYETNTLVVSDFRTMDMAAGGEGAPLVPYTEYLLYRGEKNRAVQNIGGIGNVTVVPTNCTLDDIYAFDTGPGNMIIDEVTWRLKKVRYDKNGEFAHDGKVNYELLDKLMSIKYINTPPPKTTGRELFGSQFVDKLIDVYSKKYNLLINDNDLIATVTMFTAKSIVQNYKKFIFPKCKIEEVILNGGGSYNRTLVYMIRQLLPECNVITGDEFGVSSDAKEAIAFAVLANETLNNNCSNVKGATGAKERVILGNIIPKPRK